MKTVKMIAADSGVEKDFTPEHAQNILKYQVDNHVSESLSWSIADPDWEFEGGMLTLIKKQNANQSDTGIGDKAPQRKRNTAGSDPQP